MFNKLAGVYDLGNHLLSLGLDFGWRKRLARELVSYAPKTILDLASGTADLALALKKQLTEASVIGIDLAENMLKIAAGKVLKHKLENHITLALADIEEMPFPDQSFDAVSIAFGIRNLEHRAKGLAEINRVLKPGGVLAVLEFTLPEPGLFARIYSIYLGKLLPWAGKLLSGEPSYLYLRNTIHEFPPPEAFAQELKAAGFVLQASIPLTRQTVMLFLAKKSPSLTR